MATSSSTASAPQEQRRRSNPTAPFPWAGANLLRFPNDRSFTVCEHDGKVELRMDVRLRLYTLGREYNISRPIPDVLGPLPPEMVVCLALNEVCRERKRGLVTWLASLSMRRGMGDVVHGPQLLYTPLEWCAGDHDRYAGYSQHQKLWMVAACNVYSFTLPDTGVALPIWTHVASGDSQGKDIDVPKVVADYGTGEKEDFQFLTTSTVIVYDGGLCCGWKRHFGLGDRGGTILATKRASLRLRSHVHLLDRLERMWTIPRRHGVATFRRIRDEMFGRVFADEEEGLWPHDGDHVNQLGY